MGRRATSTTKGGRYMNPADQERKVERRRELKKNKKQRVAVRQAVLKSKDSAEMIEEMLKLDHLEFDPREAPPISERVIQDKRNKMRETFLRVLSMNRQEGLMEKVQQMKRDLAEYDRKRLELQQHFMAVKFSQEVDPGEIPLPAEGVPHHHPALMPLMDPSLMPPMFPFPPGGAGSMPFPPHLMLPPGMVGPQFSANVRAPLHSILKRKQKSEFPPGVPAGAPPDLSDDEKNSDAESDEEDSKNLADREEGEHLDSDGEKITDLDKPKKTKVRFGADAEQEDGEKDSRTMYKALAKKIASGEKITAEESFFGAKASDSSHFNTISSLGSLARPPMHPHVMPRMPFVGPGGMRIPPPPSFIRPGGFQQRPSGPFIGPSVPSKVPPNHSDASVISSGPVLTAPPTINKPATKASGPTIEGKPQLRNMQLEVTKFVPTGVKIKLDRGPVPKTDAVRRSNAETMLNAPKSKGPIAFRVQQSNAAHAAQRAKAVKTTDDAYEDFMAEMKDLL